MAYRGRPKLTMTRRRRQILLELADLTASGQKVRLAELARRCGLCDYREARRILKDLKRMGAVV
jgi:predicted transcriptional regulator